MEFTICSLGELTNASRSWGASKLGARQEKALGRSWSVEEVEKLVICQGRGHVTGCQVCAGPLYMFSFHVLCMEMV